MTTQTILRFTRFILSSYSWVNLSLLSVILSSALYSNLIYADENPFATHYQVQQKGLISLLNSPNTTIYRGKNQADDNISMLENGFDLMGTSRFMATEAQPEMAVAHGKAIKADQVLLYLKPATKKNSVSQMQFYKQAIKSGQLLSEKDVEVEKNAFNHLASYWAKLPPPSLGLHLVKLTPKADLPDENKQDANTTLQGLNVLAVIHNSPAEQAGILRGDQLLNINGVTVHTAENLFTQVRQLKGKMVAIAVLRQGETKQLNVLLR